MNARNVLLWLHILVAFVTMGPLIFFDMAVPKLIRSRNAGALRFIADKGAKLGPATVVIALLGIALVLRNGDDPYSFKTRWIQVALGVYVLMVANGIGILMKNLEAAATKVEAGENADAEASRMQLFGTLNILLFLTIVWLMVAKPGF